MSIDAPDTGITGAGLPANKLMMADGRQYGTCGSCHTAGYKAKDYTRPQPFADYPNYPKSAAAGIAGSWVLDGIQCERCHDATKHYASPFTATVPQGASSTALCSQCHIRPAGWEGSDNMIRDGYVTAINNPNANTAPTAYPIGASATNFGSHLIGKQFLNSPHGLFYGSFDQIAITTGGLYKSRFSDGTRQGGCDTCHDVHQSTIVKIYPEEYPEGFAQGPIKSSAVVKFSSRSGESAAFPAIPPRAICRPSGIRVDPEHRREKRPKSVTRAKAAICRKPAGGTGLYVHVFRINTNPNYSTFPKSGATTPGICSDPYYKTKTACTDAGKSWSLVANSAPDGKYANAVWVDLDLACGKCHGEGGEAKPLSKNQLARYAKGIHGPNLEDGTPKAAMAASPTVTGYTVTFIDKSTDVEDKPYDLRISVNWGDGTIETGFAGGTFLHTYISGGTFKISHKATDTRGLSGYENVSVVVSGK